jgi:hypothetical protein
LSTPRLSNALAFAHFAGARRSRSTLGKTGALARAPSVASSSFGTIQAHPIDSLFRRMGRRAGQCGPDQSAELRQASRLRRSMAIDVGRGRSSAPVVFLLTREEAAEDKASEKLIALPDRPSKALLADKACDRCRLVMTCGGTAKAVIPTKVEPLPRQKSLRASKSAQKGNMVLPNGSVTTKYPPSSFG